MSYFLKVSAKPKAEAIEFVSVAELADLCGRSRETIKKLTDRGILPDANYRTKSGIIKRGARKGEPMQGYRLYSKHFLVPKLVEFFKGVTQGKQITLEQRSMLVTLFEEERNHLSTK